MPFKNGLIYYSLRQTQAKYLYFEHTLRITHHVLRIKQI